MEFPEDILKIINAYAKPVTRGNWRLGSSIAICNNEIRHVGKNYFLNLIFKHTLKLIRIEYNEKLIVFYHHVSPYGAVTESLLNSFV
jgi:hypothetical protein